MKKPLLFKLLALGLLFIVFLVPLGMLANLAEERRARAAEVVGDIARSTYGEQSLTGPLLVLPYRRTVQWNEISAADGKQAVVPRTRVEEGHVTLPPDTLDIKADFQVETRARQLYEARLLHADLKLSGTFTVAERGQYEQSGVGNETVSYAWTEPYLVIGTTDARGIRSLTGSFGKDPLTFLPGTRLPLLVAGVHAPVDAHPAATRYELPWQLAMSVSGTGSLAFLPVGKSTEVQMSGQWPHPSFFGSQLPVSHTVTDNGFSALWQSTHFASGITADTLRTCEAREECLLIDDQSFGVRLADPVDRYLMIERTLKYAVLFLLLTFGICFVVEVMRRIRVHPMQYGLVGAAQAMFFLLVLALSEHIAFVFAYLAAALPTVALLCHYGVSVLGGMRQGLVFGGLVTLLYGLLFGLLQSEDHALVMGSIGLFMLLAVVMVLTRRIDWYRIGEVQSVTQK